MLERILRLHASRGQCELLHFGGIPKENTFRISSPKRRRRTVPFREDTLTHFTLHCYRIDAWAIRRPWLTFVNALANSILGRFYTARTQRFASCAWPMILRKLGNSLKWKGESWFHKHKGAFCKCCWNRRDVILFSLVRKITATRENRGELLGDEVMKTASHRNCSLQVPLIEFGQLLQRRKLR